MVVGLAMLGAASCRRPLGREDAGALPVHAAGVVDVPIADWVSGDLPRPDVWPADVPVEAPRPDAAGDAGDAGRDLIPGATCPAGATPVDVCGCGCCGEAQGRACYY